MQQESIQLGYQDERSDKVYHAELKEDAEGWVVNFAYGKRGASLATGTKTNGPVAFEVAKKAYDKLVKSKVDKGYSQNGGDVSINAVSEKVDVGIRPQLLNELTEKEAESYINNANYCMQEKFDGQRRMINVNPKVSIQGANKKGQEVALTNEVIEACKVLPIQSTLDGEDMGDRIMIFDDIRASALPYRDRYVIIKVHLKNNPILRVVDTAWTTEDKRQMYNLLKEQRAEGVVFKNIDAEYTPGRPASGGNQFKCKFYETASCVVSSVSDVKSSIAVHVIAPNNLGHPMRVEVGNVTVYPNQKTPYVGAVVEVKYLYYNEGGSLYQPVLLDHNGETVRLDCHPLECTLAKLKRKKDAH